MAAVLFQIRRTAKVSLTQDRTMKRILTALLLAVTLLAAGPATLASAAVEEGMSDAKAGRVYLDAVCPSIRAADTFQRVVWRGRRTITWAELS